VLGLTSAAGYLLATRRLGLEPAGLRAATAAMLEAVGLGVLFCLANLALILIPLLTSRAIGGGFVSIYHVDYFTVASVSLLQGVVLRWWRSAAEDQRQSSRTKSSSRS
jgi:hypothetical protein